MAFVKRPASPDAECADIEGRLSRTLSLGLASACASGKLSVVRTLLASGADPDNADRQGVTMLMHAAAAGVFGGFAERRPFGVDAVAEDDDG